MLDTASGRALEAPSPTSRASGAMKSSPTMPDSEFSMPFGSEEASLLRQSRFWILQLAGWFLVLPLYFRETIEWGIRAGVAPFMMLATATGCGMGMACSSVLAAVYLRMPPRWLTGVRAVPIALTLALLGAVLLTTVMALLVAGTKSIPLGPGQSYVVWIFFNAFVLMAMWSVAFLWLMHSDQARESLVQFPRAEAFVEAKPLDPKQADHELAVAQGATPSSATESVAVPWGPDDQVHLREGKSAKFCRIRDIAYIRAADDYTEVHLSNAEVVMVRERLRYWELRLPETFIRIHRSTLINLELSEELVRLDGVWRVRLRGRAEPLTVSRRLVRALKVKLDGRQGRPSSP